MFAGTHIEYIRLDRTNKICRQGVLVFYIFIHVVVIRDPAADPALALPALLFFIPSKRRLARKICLAVAGVFVGIALLGAVYWGGLFAALGGNPDFLDIDSCLDDGGMWNYETRAGEYCRHCP